jgi:CheY-like chemotaxis protein
VVNARDAMPKGGRLRIEAANVVLDKAYAQRHVEVRPGEHVCLAVSDTGRGMSAETLAQVFEPFFTTKGLGTGLGLSTVYGIVKQSGGHITCESEPGQGTTFRLYLSRVEDAAVRESEEGEADLPRVAQGRTVLVVEDSRGVRNFVCQALRRAGYEVLAAADGDAALELARAHRGPIDLLLSDVILPGPSGPRVAERIRAARSGIGVLFMSGYAEDTISKHGVLDPGVELIEKPFTSRALALRVGKVIARRARSA